MRLANTADLIAARELQLFANNDSITYFNSIKPTAANMDRKRARGCFDPERAAVAFGHVAEYAARRYASDFGGRWCEVFNAATRRAAAEMLLDDYMNN